MKNRMIMTTAFGDRRENVLRLIKNIRHYVDYPICIITSEDSNISLPAGSNFSLGKRIYIKYVPRLWPDHPRSGQRNGDYYQMKGVLFSEYSSILYLDDDMLIVNKDFVQGFDLAEKFGFCLPLNPRSFVGVDAAIGVDVPNLERQVKIPFATAYNCGTMFINKLHLGLRYFLRAYCDYLMNNPMRGPLAVWKTVEKTSIVPYILPSQWCVCAEDVGCHNPIILHYGHRKVQEHYNIAMTGQ